LDSEGFDYQKIVQDALRDAVRRVLVRVVEEGLPGEHYFYVGFRTDQPGVEIPRSLRQQYPEEMTVILQNQFWDLTVEPESFSVVLSFNGARERLTVPFAALTAFVDPAAEFGLRFDGEKATGGEKGAGGEKAVEAEASGPRKVPDKGTEETATAGPSSIRKEPAKPKEKREKKGAVVPFDPTRRR